MELVRKPTYITVEQERALKRLAERHHTTEAELIRCALDYWLDNEAREGRGDPFAGFLGVFDGPVEVGHNDIYR